MLMPGGRLDAAAADCERGNECLVFDARAPSLFVRFLLQNERTLKGKHGGDDPGQRVEEEEETRE